MTSADSIASVTGSPTGMGSSLASSITVRPCRSRYATRHHHISPVIQTRISFLVGGSERWFVIVSTLRSALKQDRTRCLAHLPELLVVASFVSGNITRAIYHASQLHKRKS